MSADNPQNPYSVSLGAGSAPQNRSIGRNGEIYTSQVHGKYYAAAYYSRVFAFNRTAVTVPAIAGSLASLFSLYNPPNSTVNAELIDFDAGFVLATTVVDTIGLYWQGPTLASLGTLGAVAVLGTDWFPGILGGNAGNVQPYRAFTHSGTPVRVDILGTSTAVAVDNPKPMHKDLDGKIIVPPGHVVSVALSTTVWTTSGMDLGIRWLECPPF